tara:strand:- start:957 stop:1880 length:924 start_codon:yes stop_codon:yes gene_type:complete
MKYKSLIFLIINFIFLNINGNSLENKILFKINNKIITSVDIANEVKILKMLNKNINDLSKVEVFKIAETSIKKETFKEIELLQYREELKLPENILNSYLLRYSKKLGFSSLDEFSKYCLQNFIDIKLIEKKIIIELLWSRYIYEKFSQNVKVDKNIIKEDILRNNFINEYLLSEIVFKIKNKEELEIQLKSLENSIKNVGFENTALKYSISDSSKKGGKLGWVKEISLSRAIKNIVKKTDVGNYTSPIKIGGGYLILKIEDIKKTKNNIDIEKEIEKAVIERTEIQLNQFSNIYLNKLQKDLIINAF